MILTGKYFEEIVSMLNIFRSEVQTCAALGLTNINKHSENFIKRLLNLTYDHELENLNKGKSNFPGLDLGDVGEGIAYQVSATKKTDKIEETLGKCMKFEHYRLYKDIRIFILTKKQSSYTIKTITEPYFTFIANKNIFDIDDLLKDIETLDLRRLKAMNLYIKEELQEVINSLKENEEKKSTSILDTEAALEKAKLKSYSLWKGDVILSSKKISVPDIHDKLEIFLPRSPLRNIYLPLFNVALRKNTSNKKMLYMEELHRTTQSNYFYGNAMQLKPSSIGIERANYTDGEIMFNLLPEMISLLTTILFFSKISDEQFEISVNISLEANTKVYFIPVNSLVTDRVLNNFILDSPFLHTEVLTDVETSTIVDLLQKIMHAFISSQPNVLSSDPFVKINRESTEFVISNIKRELGIIR